MTETLYEAPLTLKFGKYKDKDLSEVIKDQSYCKWLISQPFVKEEIKKYINDNCDMNNHIMRWGKYKGKSIGEIFDNDKKYIFYLENNDYVKENCQDIIEAIKKLKEI